MSPAAFGPYQVVRPLGAGGMGTVWEVRHPELAGRRLALKLAREAPPGSTARGRFLREAELLARVRHPGVVAVHASGAAPEGPWLVMDLVEGETLAHLLRRGPLPPARAAELVARVADAVAALHAAGVLHRDLKPENVVLRPDGAPVVIDLGLARAADAERLTRTGALVGTPVYMAPEQLDGTSPERLDPRVDVWGLGTLLYALLVGQAPFQNSPSLGDTLRRIQGEEPAWPAVPEQLLAVLRRALAKRPAERWADGAELARALAAVTPGASPPGAGQARAGWGAAGVGVALLGAVLLVGALVAVPRSGVDPPRPAGPSPAPSPPPAPAPEPAPREAAPRPWLRLEHPGGPARAGAGFAGAGRLLSWALPAPSERGPTQVVEWRGEPPVPGRRWELPGPVTLLRLSPGAGRAVLVCQDAPWLLEPDVPEPLRPLRLEPPRQGLLTALALAPGGDRFALAWPADEDGPARAAVFELRGARAVQLGQDHPLRGDPRIGQLLLCADGRLVLGGGERMPDRGGSALAVVPAPGENAARRELPFDFPCPSLAEDRQGRVWLGTNGWGIHRLSADGIEPGLLGVATESAVDRAAGLGRPGSHRAPVAHLRFDPAGERLYSASSPRRDGLAPELRGWEPGPGGEWRNTAGLAGWPAAIDSLDLSPDGERLLVAHGGRIERWARLALPTLRGDEEALPEHARVVRALTAGAR